MQVFIVRPFGIKQVLKKANTGLEKPVLEAYDFDRIEKELIIPAMNNLELEGGTTGKIFEAGEIREDMFSELLLADIVVADISIHNANVFYELGIRHALKNKTTVLIKCPGYDETPFDILGFRFVSYDKEDPAAAIPLLMNALQDSQVSDRTDSPVFFTMPSLALQDTEKFFIVPCDFIEEVELATRNSELGKLALLASEADFFSWKIPALRLIGGALVNMKAFDYARLVWEKIKEKKPHDIETNINLATIYQRLAEQETAYDSPAANSLLALSDFAIQNLFDANEFSGADNKDLSIVYALKGRNLKTRWVNELKSTQPENISATALSSVYLEAAYHNYEKGYYENLHYFHCGINALGFLTILLALADRHRDLWALSFETEEEAMEKLDDYTEKHQSLSVCIRMALNIAKEKMTEEEQVECWLNLTEADLVCLSSNKPARVALLYKRALQNANQLQKETCLRQLKIFEMLNILADNTKAALEAFPAVHINKNIKTHYLLFTGHMLDKAGRPKPRFPAEKENAVKEKIKLAIEQEQKISGTDITGISGAACGADIIFHECCQELGIGSKLFLAIPREPFIQTSVAFAGPAWIERFDRLYKKLPVFILAKSIALPKWLTKKAGYNIWKRNNLWELHAALSNGGLCMTLIALWDGLGGDGTGGTEHMVAEAKEKGAKIILIDMNKI